MKIQPAPQVETPQITNRPAEEKEVISSPRSAEVFDGKVVSPEVQGSKQPTYPTSPIHPAPGMPTLPLTRDHESPEKSETGRAAIHPAPLPHSTPLTQPHVHPGKTDGLPNVTPGMDRPAVVLPVRNSADSSDKPATTPAKAIGRAPEAPTVLGVSHPQAGKHGNPVGKLPGGPGKHDLPHSGLHVTPAPSAPQNAPQHVSQAPSAPQNAPQHVSQAPRPAGFTATPGRQAPESPLIPTLESRPFIDPSRIVSRDGPETHHTHWMQ